MKIYEYRVDHSLWDTDHAAIVIASSRSLADNIYVARLEESDRMKVLDGTTDLIVTEFNIEEGMVIVPLGFDRTGLDVNTPNNT